MSRLAGTLGATVGAPARRHPLSFEVGDHDGSLRRDDGFGELIHQDVPAELDDNSGVVRRLA